MKGFREQPGATFELLSFLAPLLIVGLSPVSADCPPDGHHRLSFETTPKAGGAAVSAAGATTEELMSVNQGDALDSLLAALPALPQIPTRDWLHLRKEPGASVVLWC